MNSIIKLTNGETIVAEIVHQDETTTSILEPIALEIGESESGKPMMVAMTWIPLTKKVNMVNLNTNHVVAVADVDEDIDRYYIKSLAILKQDLDKLREILKDEAGVEDLEEIAERVRSAETEFNLDDEEVTDPWMEKFGQPIELSANTVH
jgi:transcriptional regulator of heat shock response